MSVIQAKSSISVMPGIGDVVLGPLGARERDPGAGLVHEVLEVAVVERDLGQGHSYSSAGTM